MRGTVASMRFVALLAALAVAAGCGADDDPEPPAAAPPPAATPGPPPPAPPATTGTETTPGGATSVAVYLLLDGRVHPVRREIEPTQAVARAALGELFGGPTAEERDVGLDTGIEGAPAIERLSIADGIATVDLEPCPPMAQVVFTLTQFPSVEAVAGACSGGRRLTRTSLEDASPAILVESPLLGDAAASPLRIRGTANTFEANFQVEVVDWDGRIVAEDFVTATSGSGTRGTFDASIPFEVNRPGGALIVFESSAKDGSRMNLVEIPLALQP